MAARRTSVRARFLAFSCAGICAATAGASTLSAQVEADRTRLRADSLDRAGLHGEAFAALEALLSGGTRDPLLETLAAEQGLLASFLAPNADSARSLLHRAIERARRALALEPSSEQARYLNLAAHGRLGLLESSPQERARLGVVVDSAARSLLAANPRHGEAHNALGRLYAEVADLDWFSRLFARRWMGGDLVDRATWEAAEEHLRLAVELRPERNMHLLDLGALLLKRGRKEDARQVLQAAASLPLETPAQMEFRDAARRLLAEIGGAP